ESVGAGEDNIATDENMSETEKRDLLQRTLNMAASNGDVERVKRLVSGKAREYVDVNMPDEEGTVPLIYASCFVGGCLPVLGSSLWNTKICVLVYFIYGNRETAGLGVRRLT